jgi:nucleoid-associated protein YgaU
MGGGTLQADLDRLASLGPTLQGLAEEASRLNSNLPMCPTAGMEPAVLEASEIARDLVDSAMVSALSERLSEAGEIMVNVANQFRDADDEALEVAMQTYTEATGDWMVPEAPESHVPQPNPPQPVTQKHTVVSGDTLWALSDRFYGDATQYPKIADASGISNTDLLHRGQVLTIPDVPTDDRPENDPDDAG